jgi:hypothetical protein
MSCRDHELLQELAQLSKEVETPSAVARSHQSQPLARQLQQRMGRGRMLASGSAAGSAGGSSLDSAGGSAAGGAGPGKGPSIGGSSTSSGEHHLAATATALLSAAGAGAGPAGGVLPGPTLTSSGSVSSQSGFNSMWVCDYGLNRVCTGTCPLTCQVPSSSHKSKTHTLRWPPLSI